MGVAGSGKTTIGSLLAKEMDWSFADADDFHPAANVEKISRGIALDDTDRAPWLAAIRNNILGWIAEHQNIVLACSALKEAYRQQLSVSSEVKFVYLQGTYPVIYQRLHNRHGHFATEQILASQFAALEEPTDATTVDVSGTPEQIVGEIRRRLGLR